MAEEITIDQSKVTKIELAGATIIDTSGDTAAVGDVKKGCTFHGSLGSMTGIMPSITFPTSLSDNPAATTPKTITPGTTTKYININAGYSDTTVSYAIKPGGKTEAYTPDGTYYTTNEDSTVSGSKIEKDKYTTDNYYVKRCTALATPEIDSSTAAVTISNYSDTHYKVGSSISGTIKATSDGRGWFDHQKSLDFSGKNNQIGLVPKATFTIDGADIKTTNTGAGYVPANTTVATIPPAGKTNITTSTATTAVPIISSAGYTSVISISGITVPENKTLTVNDNKGQIIIGNSHITDVKNHSLTYITNYTDQRTEGVTLKVKDAAESGDPSSSYHDIIVNGAWAEKTCAPSSTTQGPFYGKVTVNPVDASNVTISKSGTTEPPDTGKYFNKVVVPEAKTPSFSISAATGTTTVEIEGNVSNSYHKIYVSGLTGTIKPTKEGWVTTSGLSAKLSSSTQVGKVIDLALPVAATTTTTYTIEKAVIPISGGTRYLEIPAGYNGGKRYYTIKGFPLYRSGILYSSKIYYLGIHINIDSDIISQVTYFGGSGLDKEEGTFVKTKGVGTNSWIYARYNKTDINNIFVNVIKTENTEKEFSIHVYGWPHSNTPTTSPSSATGWTEIYDDKIKLKKYLFINAYLPDSSVSQYLHMIGE